MCITIKFGFTVTLCTVPLSNGSPRCMQSIQRCITNTHPLDKVDALAKIENSNLPHKTVPTSKHDQVHGSNFGGHGQSI